MTKKSGGSFGRIACLAWPCRVAGLLRPGFIRRRGWPPALLARGVVLAALLLVHGAPALAHSPHDDVFDVKPSPGFAQDRAVFAIVRSAFLASRDGGSTWRRMVNGLDHKHMLYTLDVAGDGRTIYVASLGDGVYRSTDAGLNWTHVSAGLEALTVDLVAVAPDSPDLAFAAGVGGGLFRTHSAGDSWQRVRGAFGKVTAIGFPRQSDHILLGDHRGGLYRSRDGGVSWMPLYRAQLAGAITAIAVSPSYPADPTILLGTSTGTILRSENGGESFTVMAPSSARQPVLSIALSPSFATDRIAFASLWDDGVYCSTDGGQRWHRGSRGLTGDRQAQRLGRPSFSRLRVSPNFAEDRTVFLAGFDGLFRTTDGGQRWREVATLSPLNVVGVAVSPTHDQDSTLAVTTWMWGAYLSQDRGKTWRAINGGAVDRRRDNGLTRLFNVVFSPDYATDETLFTSTWYRFLKSTDGGRRWRQIVPANGPEWTRTHHGSTVAVSPNFREDGTIFLGTHQGLLLRSLDRGETFALLKDVGNVVGSLVVSPDFAVDRTVLAGDTYGVYRSRDAGVSWEFYPLVADSLHGDIPVSPAYPADKAAPWKAHQLVQRGKAYGLKLALSPAFSADRTAFAGTPNGLFRSRDGGQSWQRLCGNPFADDAYIEAVAISPAFGDDHTLLVSVRGRGHFRSRDGGDSFSEMGAELMENQDLLATYVGMVPKFPSIVFSPTYATDKTIYGFSGPKLFKSADDGDTWYALPGPAPSRFTQSYVWWRYHIGRYAKKKKVQALTALTGVVALSAVFMVFRGRRA